MGKVGSSGVSISGRIGGTLGSWPGFLGAERWPGGCDAPRGVCMQFFGDVNSIQEHLFTESPHCPLIGTAEMKEKDPGKNRAGVGASSQQGGQLRAMPGFRNVHVCLVLKSLRGQSLAHSWHAVRLGKLLFVLLLGGGAYTVPGTTLPPTVVFTVTAHLSFGVREPCC